jgi:hypothetical protein
MSSIIAVASSSVDSASIGGRRTSSAEAWADDESPTPPPPPAPRPPLGPPPSPPLPQEDAVEWRRSDPFDDDTEPRCCGWPSGGCDDASEDADRCDVTEFCRGKFSGDAVASAPSAAALLLGLC